MNNIDKFLIKNNYVDSIEKDSNLLDSWIDKMEDYNIYYKTNPKSDIFTLNESDKKIYHIIWDSSFWDIYLKFYYIIDEKNLSPKLDTNMLIKDSGYMLALFFDYLSTRFGYYSELVNELRENAKNFGYQFLVDNLYGNLHESQTYDFEIMICKQFAFWHEIAHAEFHKYDDENGLYQHRVEVIYSLLENLPEEITFNTDIIEKIRARTISKDLVEELAADLRAFQRLMQFEELSNIKENLDRFIQAVNVLINFITIKSMLDKQWDHYVNQKNGIPPTSIETQILRRIFFPAIIYIAVGREELGDSIIYDVDTTQRNIELFCRNLDIIKNEWYIKLILDDNYNGIDMDIYNQLNILNIISTHMSNITVETSCKRLKYLFNIAHTAQHSLTPLDSIPLFMKFIEYALKKENENKRNIGDAYSRMARVYAENGQFIKAEIMINNAVDIVEKIYKNDIYSAFLYNNIGNVFSLLNNNDEALKYYNSSMEIRVKFNDLDSISMAVVYRNLGVIYYRRQDSPLSLKYYLKAYRIMKRRYDMDNIELIRLKIELKAFAEFNSNVSGFCTSLKYPLYDLKQAYMEDIDDIDCLRNYLWGIVRDILLVPFDMACDLFIELVELVETNVNKDSTLLAFLLYGMTNFSKPLLTELSDM